MNRKKMSLSSLLFEQTKPEQIQTIPTDISPKATQQPQNYSLDQRVDHFLIQYERDANPTNAKNTGNAFKSALNASSSTGNPLQEKRNFSIKSFIWEQEAALSDPGLGAGGGPVAPTGGDLGGLGDLGGGGGGIPSEEPSDVVVPKPQLNLSTFANKLSRLINNFEDLINPKVVILNRAYAFIRQNYDENTAKELLITLENTYDISNKTLKDKERLMVGTVPFAAGAGDGSVTGGG